MSSGIGISIFFISWTIGMALLGYKYGYSDGWECCNKEWKKKIEGLKDEIKERKNKRNKRSVKLEEKNEEKNDICIGDNGSAVNHRL